MMSMQIVTSLLLIVVSVMLIFSSIANYKLIKKLEEKEREAVEGFDHV